MRGLVFLLTICTALSKKYDDYTGVKIERDKSVVSMGSKDNDVALVRKGFRQLLIDSAVEVNGDFKVKGVNLLAELLSLKAEVAKLRKELQEVAVTDKSWKVVQSSLKTVKPDAAAFKKLVKKNWNGDYSPWFRWQVAAKGSNGPLYADIRVRFKNTYDVWAASHKGDNVGKLHPYWSASIPSLKVAYRDVPGLVRAVMIGEKFSGVYGLHYKRTHNGEHYPWWNADGSLAKNGKSDWGGYLCTKPETCGYSGCIMYDTSKKEHCKHSGGTTFAQVITVCNSLDKSDCEPNWGSSTWSVVQSSVAWGHNTLLNKFRVYNPSTKNFKALVKSNWNGQYSPWFKWEMYTKDMSVLFADIRVRFKNTYDEWVTSHKGDNVGKLQAFWSGNIPSLKITYRDWPGLVRAVMLNEKFSTVYGLHYKRTPHGEHYPWWGPDGAHAGSGYLCIKESDCGYVGCQFYDTKKDNVCKHSKGKDFQHVSSVCIGDPATCAPQWKPVTWTNVQSNFQTPSMGNNNAVWFKNLMKMNWNGAYSPWVRWQIFAHDKKKLYADIRVRFKNTYNDWVSSHKGDNIGKLKAYWSANIPDLKVSYRNKEGLVRAVMMGNNFSGDHWGIHYKRTGQGEHYPWWTKDGKVSKSSGYLCVSKSACGYAGCSLDGKCKWNGQTKFHHTISVCTAQAKGLCEF